MAVIVCGFVGGSISTVLPAGTDVPWPDAMADLVKDRRLVNFRLHAGRNMALGGLASFLVWGLYSTEARFDADDVTVRQAVSSIIVGGGGGTIVNNFFRQAQRIDAFSKTIDNVERLLDSFKRGGHDGSDQRKDD